MPMDPQLKGQLNQTINVALPSGAADVHGGRTFGAPAARAARVEEDRQVVDVGTGNERVTSHHIITELEIASNARVWLPGDATTIANARAPMKRRPATDEDGTIHHHETWV